MPAPRKLSSSSALVLRAASAQVRVDLLLGQPVRAGRAPAQAHRLGDLAVEDLLYGADADRGEHRVEIRGGDGGVATQVPAVSLAASDAL